MIRLLNICQEWGEVLTPKREELKEWKSVTSVEGGHVISVVGAKEWFQEIEKTKSILLRMG